MLRRILVTSDGSERAGRAVAFAADLAGRYGAELTVLHVRVGDNVVPQRDLDKQAAAAGATVAVVEDSAPAEAICRHAEENGCDAIVLGNYGMSDRKQFLLGNVPNRVSHQAQCTVIIVDTRDPKERKRHRGR
ncbi:MAG TPA: universal stress protein [Actinomycetota bacterium]|nr:universal stress protein [Actinomycetota bacterium]